MPVSPIDVATQGYLNSPLSVAVDGYLIIEVDAVVDRGGGSSAKTRTYRTLPGETLESWKERMMREDEEILEIIIVATRYIQ